MHGNNKISLALLKSNVIIKYKKKMKEKNTHKKKEMERNGKIDNNNTQSNDRKAAAKQTHINIDPDKIKL